MSTPYQGWGKPATGYIALRLPAIRSPNYVTGLSGWTINQDGSVEFTNGIFRGVITNTGTYIYSGTPASGNLLESLGIVSAGTDPSGLNAVLPGDTRYHNNGAGVFVAQQSTQSYVARLWQATSALGPYTDMTTSVAFINEFTSAPILQLNAHASGGLLLMNDPVAFNPIVGTPVISQGGALWLDSGTGFFKLQNAAGGPGTINADSWQVAGLLNTWGGTLNYRKLADSSLMQVFGLIQPGATNPVTTVFNVPAAYQPKNSGGTVVTVNSPVFDSTANVVHNSAIDTTFRIAGTYAAGTDNVVVNIFIPLAGP